ncbi:MAG TPA: TrkA family potassium uptake protein [Candidatus Eisenbacteria bacterium]|nr:TrkA family potassium uptake protein [Candidatus Eisenbacteria bacterium]
MKIVIVGCGRVGSVLADGFDTTGHEVVILDLSTRAFDRLPQEFKGQAVRGDGTDEDVLRRVGTADADVFLALTEGDNRNVMAAQIAVENLGVKRAVAKINDPVRAAAYAELGIATICRTTMLSDAIQSYLGLAPSGIPSIISPVAPHHEGGHGRSGGGGDGAATGGTAIGAVGSETAAGPSGFATDPSNFIGRGS